MKPTLLPYRPKGKCPKCGSKEISTTYRRAGFACGRIYDCENGDDGNCRKNVKECLERHCQNCHYEWHESVKEDKK